MRLIKFGILALVLAASLMSKEASAQVQITTVTGAGSARADSWVAGLVFGYNWQQGPMVFGVETDFQGMGLKNTINPTLVYAGPPTFTTDFATASSTIDRYGTLRGRIGTTFGSVLLYVTGGLAYGLVDLNSTFQAFGLTTTASNTQTRVGGVVGAGAEYLIKPNWMLTFQYQYVDLGRVSVASSASGAGPAFISQSATTRADFQTAMIGLSFRFAPEGSGSLWAGGYGGIHGGGAWGNSTSAVYDGVSLGFID